MGTDLVIASRVPNIRVVACRVSALAAKARAGEKLLPVGAQPPAWRDVSKGRLVCAPEFGAQIADLGVGLAIDAAASRSLAGVIL